MNDNDNDVVEAPFNDLQLRRIKDWQESGIFHPLTCPGEHPSCVQEDRTLIPTSEGMICRCGMYVQKWVPRIVAGAKKDIN